MAVTANVYANFFDKAASGLINYASDTINMALLTSSYTPNLATHAVYTDLTNEVAAGGGYSTGGQAIGTKTHTVTAANSWTTTNGNFTNGSWAGTTAASAGNIVKAGTPNGYLYICTVAGTTGSSAAVLNSGPTIQGHEVTDGSVTWSCLGESISVFSSAAVTWASSTITARYAVLYDNAGTKPLLAVVNFGTDQSSSNGNFTVTPSVNGWFFICPQ